MENVLPSKRELEFIATKLEETGIKNQIIHRCTLSNLTRLADIIVEGTLGPSASHDFNF